MTWILVITCFGLTTSTSLAQPPSFTGEFSTSSTRLSSPPNTTTPPSVIEWEMLTLPPLALGTCGSLDDICYCNKSSQNPNMTDCVGRNCFCDRDCTENGDCCVDYEELPPKYPDSLQRPWIKSVLRCDYIQQISNDNMLVHIDRCPHNYTDLVVIRQCQTRFGSQLFDWPVIGKLSGFLYRNFYCGICNGEFDVEFLAVHEQCYPDGLQVSSSTNASEIDDAVRANQLAVARRKGISCFNRKYVTQRVLKTCNLSDSQTRPKTHSIDSCAADWNNETVVKLCKSYTSFVSVHRVNEWISNRKPYKNVYCLLCNGHPLETADCYIRSTIVFSVINPQTPPILRVPIPSLQKGGITYFPMSVLFDVNQGTVRTSSDVGFEDLGNRKIEAEAKTMQCQDGSMALANTCVKIYCPKNMIFKEMKCVEITQTTKTVVPIFFDIPKLSEVIRFNSSVVPKHRHVGALKNLTKEDQKVNVNECLFTDISSFRFHVYDNDTILLETLQIYLEPSSYENVSVNGTYQIHACLPVDVFEGKNITTWNNRSRTIFTFKYDSSQTMLSFVGQIISVTALFVLLIVYCSAPSLRNTPGKCLMCLSLSLFLALLLHLIGIGRLEPHSLCYAFAVLIHYFYLSSFFWMNIMSFDMFRVFAQSFTSSTSENGRKKFLYYNTYGWCTPLILVITAVIIDQVSDPEDSNFSPQYGINLCFISNRNALLVYFVIPLGALILANFIFFALTARGIYQAMKQASRVRKAKKERCKIFLYLKISVIMGLTWVFGFLLTTASDISWLTYMFIVLNAFQGLFICIAFLLSKKVLKICCQRFGKKSATSTSNTNKQGTYTLTTPLTSRKDLKNNSSTASPSLAVKTNQNRKETCI